MDNATKEVTFEHALQCLKGFIRFNTMSEVETKEFPRLISYYQNSRMGAKSLFCLIYKMEFEELDSFLAE